MKRLNLGCGTDIRDGWINLDSANLPGVDVVHDLNILPLPFANDEFDLVLCNDVLEHLEYIPLMRELHRIVKKGGEIEIKVPHFTSVFNFIDPTHKKMFSFQTFEFFTKESGRSYYFDFSFEKVVKSKIKIANGGIGRIVQFYINLTRRRKQKYEEGFLSRLFPASNLLITLVK